MTRAEAAAKWCPLCSRETTIDNVSGLLRWKYPCITMECPLYSEQPGFKSMVGRCGLNKFKD